MSTFRPTLHPRPSVVAGILAVVTALALWLGTVPAARAGEGETLAKGALDITAQASKAANKAAAVVKVIDLVDMLKNARNPCPCAQKLVAALIEGSMKPAGAKGGPFADAFAKCFPALDNSYLRARNELAADEMLGKLPSGDGQLALLKVRQYLNDECDKRKKEDGQSFFFYTPLDPGREQALASALASYRLPGSRPLAVGDLDGDGGSDLAVCDPQADTVAILLADGFGGYRAAGSHFTGLDPSFVFIDDVDDDGRNDIVVLNTGSEDGALFLGNGDGTIQPPILFNPLRDGQGTAIVDVNSDGTDDRVSVVEVGNHLSVEFGATDDFYDIFLDFAADAVLPADLDRDGVVDLAVRLGETGEVAVASGSGDGTFTVPVIFPFSSLRVSESPAETEPVGIGIEPLPFFDVGMQLLDPGGIRETPLLIAPAPTVPKGSTLMFGR